ncbi:MAG: hypothetical protein A2070_03470 [Bdellovibrionales bacterium GWC1_52_8]|nr:MAG: hypothetical protein A2X97_15430 [Bdellovibrionales bacterium GWA1_52_35]OFZ32351.1 MAG: hypothetical protein A2070_03470 [Bdellovibrionales bacterium GWC1_52_8]
MKIGVVAPSFKVPLIEFQLGIERIREEGFSVQVHPQCKQSQWYFAGTDEERAKAFFEYAMDPGLRAIWYARGGYGAGRLLSHLDRLTKMHGLPPRKLLLGFSDATAMHEYVKNRWGWHTLHSPMPGLRSFCALKSSEWQAILGFLRGEKITNPWGPKPLKFQDGAPSRDVVGELVGGNLTVVTSLVGTPYAVDARGKIVFFEDVDEALYRIDRMVQQLLDSKALEGAKAIVLGNFLSCRDPVPLVLGVKPTAKNMMRMIRSPKKNELVRLRKRLVADKAIREIFERLGRELKIPVAYGLPVGHGPEKTPLPLGAKYRLGRDGALTLLQWEWTDARK